MIRSFFQGHVFASSRLSTRNPTAPSSFHCPEILFHASSDLSQSRGAVSEERSVPDSTVLTPDIHKPVPSPAGSALWKHCRYSHIRPLFWQIPRRKGKKISLTGHINCCCQPVHFLPLFFIGNGFSSLSQSVQLSWADT